MEWEGRKEDERNGKARRGIWRRKTTTTQKDLIELSALCSLEVGRTNDARTFLHLLRWEFERHFELVIRQAGSCVISLSLCEVRCA